MATIGHERGWAVAIAGGWSDGRTRAPLHVLRAFGTPTNGLWAAEEVAIHVAAGDLVPAVDAARAAHDTLVALHRTLPADADVRAPVSWLARHVARVLGGSAERELHALREHEAAENAPTIAAPIWTPPRPNAEIRAGDDSIVVEVHLPSGLAFDCALDRGLLTVTLRIAAASHNLGLWAHEYAESGECIDTTAIDLRAGSRIGHAILGTATPHRVLVGPWAQPPDHAELERDAQLDAWRAERFTDNGPVALAESLAGQLADALEGVDASHASGRDRYLAAATTAAVPRPRLIGWVLDHARYAHDEDAAALALEMALTIDQDDASAAALDLLLDLREGHR